MSAPLSMRACVSMTFIVCEGTMICKGIHMDLDLEVTVTCTP